MPEKSDEKCPKETTNQEVLKIYSSVPKSLLKARLEAEAKDEDQASLEAMPIGNESVQFINENIEKNPCFCEICNKEFITSQTLAEHVASEHESKKAEADKNLKLEAEVKAEEKAKKEAETDKNALVKAKKAAPFAVAGGQGAGGLGAAGSDLAGLAGLGANADGTLGQIGQRQLDQLEDGSLQLSNTADGSAGLQFGGLLDVQSTGLAGPHNVDIGPGGSGLVKDSGIDGTQLSLGGQNGKGAWRHYPNQGGQIKPTKSEVAPKNSPIRPRAKSVSFIESEQFIKENEELKLKVEANKATAEEELKKQAEAEEEAKKEAEPEEEAKKDAEPEEEAKKEAEPEEEANKEAEPEEEAEKEAESEEEAEKEAESEEEAEKEAEPEEKAEKETEPEEENQNLETASIQCPRCFRYYTG